MTNRRSLHEAAADAHAEAAAKLDEFHEAEWHGRCEEEVDALLAEAFDLMWEAIAASHRAGFLDVDESDCETPNDHRSVEARHRRMLEWSRRS